MTPGSGTALWTVMALVAFAGNSILTRLALGGGQLEAASFTLVRLAAGALVLAGLARGRGGTWAFVRGRRLGGPMALFAYAAAFSYAYVRIGAALGALILFAAVQVTILVASLFRRERPGPRVYLGLVLALGSLAWLVAPRVDRPDPVGILLMVGAGVAWGGYTLVGKGADDPVASNARSFCLTIPLALGLFAVTPSAGRVSGPGLALAAVSGAVTSGLGYAVWYRALRGLGSAQAALLQLLVPILAALGAVVFLGETLTLRLVLSGVGVLAGVGLALVPQGVLPWSCPSGRKSG